MSNLAFMTHKTSLVIDASARHTASVNEISGDLVIDPTRVHIDDGEFYKLIFGSQDGDLLIENFLVDCEEEFLAGVIEANPKLEKRLQRILKGLNDGD